MKQNARCTSPKNISRSITMSTLAVFSACLLLFLATATTPAQGQQQRFFLPSGNNGNFAIPRGSFQEDADSDEVIVPQRRLSSANPLPIQSNPSSSSFFPSQQQLPPGTFTNSGPFSRPPTAQFILNGQTQFQAVRSPGSLSFSDTLPTVSQPSFFQQAPIQRPQQQQQQQQPPQQQPQFNFFQSNSQQQRFRPIVQQQDSIEEFEEQQNPQPSLVPQQSSQERFTSDSSRRPLTQINGIPGARNPSPAGSIRWWNPTPSDTESVSGNVNSDEESTVGPKDDSAEFNQQRQIQSQKRGRVPPQQEKRRPAITTHRPQSGLSSFRNVNNSPASVPGTTINRRPTTYNPSSIIISSTTSVKPPSLKPSESSEAVNRQPPSTIRGRKPVLFSTTTTTESTLEDDPEQEEPLPVEEKRQFIPRKSTTTTQSPQFPITTLRAALRPRLNSSAVSTPQQQQRMKKIVNNPSILQSVMVRKPILTSTSTSTPKTTTHHQIVEEYEDYEDEYTTAALTTIGSTNRPITQSPITKQQNNNTLMTTSESWFVVASVQTSRSVSSNSGGGTNMNHTVQDVTEFTTSNPTNKHRFNNKPTPTTPSTTTVESIIDKLDRVQSELSNGILYGSSSNTNNSSRILTEIQSSSNTEDKRNDAIIPFFTTPMIEKTTETTTATTTTTTTTTTTPPPPPPPPPPPSTTTTTTTTTKATTTKATTTTEETEDDDKEEEEEESDDSDKEPQFVRKFTPSKGRTTPATITTVSTVKALTQTGKKKSLIDNVKFDELLTSGLLPPGFNAKPPPAYKSKTITTTTETPVTNTVNSFKPNITSSTTINTTPLTSSTTVKSKSSNLNIKFTDDSSALAALLPPGFKLEDAIKPLDTLSPSLLPPGFKLPAENENTTDKSKEPETILTTIMPTIEVSLSTTTTPTTVASSSTTGLVFPNSGKGTNNSGTRKPLPSSKKIQASVTIAPVIQKGWPVRATTEFTGWSTPSTTPLSIEKLLQQSKASDLASAMTSTSEPISSTTTTTTTTTTTMKPPPTTTPGQCSESDSVCELVGTVRLVGSGSEKWVPELLDHNTAEWRLLASEIETQLDKVYSKSPALSKWYKKITIDSFSPGNNEISDGKSDKNAGVLVDFFVQLNQLGRTVSTTDIRRLFHETLQKEANLGSSAQPLQYGNGGDYERAYLKLGRFTVDPARTDFIVLPKTNRGVTANTGTDDAWLPQWAVAVMVIGLASLLFVLIFGITVLVSRHKNNQKIPPPTLQTSIISDEHHQHMYGTGKNGPTTGSRHMMHHPPSHSNSNYNISSYGYDNYAIDDDMMMLDEDDLEDVDRLYDMDAVWADHDHEKLKVSSNNISKKHRDSQHGGHYDSWRSTALAPQTLSPVQPGYYSGGGAYGYGTDPNIYGGGERRHYHREGTSATNPRSHHHYHPGGSHHNPNLAYTTTPRKPPQQYHPDYDTDF